jgi:diguanylate cyclase (GGDEF)-like protein
MHAHGAGVAEHSGTRRALKSLVTEQLRVVLEQRSVRIGAIGFMLVAASAFGAFVPMPEGVDTGWMFIVPVAISAIAGGLKEGLIVALTASCLGGLFSDATSGGLDLALLLSAVTARFSLHGLTALVLGAFAETHYAVQSNLRAMALEDPLTKVANVTRFYEELGILEAQPTSHFALLLVDVDNLKKLNDLWGHQVGSAAIQTVARTLGRVVRGSDCVARFGGDEFVVILRDADRPGAQIVVNRIRELLSMQALPGAPGVAVQVSVGVAMFGEDGQTSEQLIATADAAMYDDKRRRKGLVYSGR